MPFGSPQPTPPRQFEGHDLRDVYRMNDPVTGDEIERCKADGEWKTLARGYSAGSTLIAFETPGGRVFCALTATTVAVSPPTNQGLDGSPARVQFTAPNGAVAGLIRPGATHLSLLTGPASTLPDSTIAALAGDVFLAPAGFRAGADTTFLIDGTEVRADAVPQPVTAVTDVALPPAERTSEAGQRLGQCVANQPVADAAQFAPGAHSRLADGDVQLGRFGGLLVHCTPAPTVTDIEAPPPTVNVAVLGKTIHGLWHFYDFKPDNQGATSSDTRAIFGSVFDERVASIVLTSPGQLEQAAVLTNGTFILRGPVPYQGARIVVRDAAGTVLEELDPRQ